MIEGSRCDGVESQSEKFTAEAHYSRRGLLLIRESEPPLASRQRAPSAARWFRFAPRAQFRITWFARTAATLCRAGTGCSSPAARSSMSASRRASLPQGSLEYFPLPIEIDSRACRRRHRGNLVRPAPGYSGSSAADRADRDRRTLAGNRPLSQRNSFGAGNSADFRGLDFARKTGLQRGSLLTAPFYFRKNPPPPRRSCSLERSKTIRCHPESA